MAEIVLLRCSKEIKRLGFALVSPHQLASWFIAPKDAQDARLYTRLVLCKLELVDSLCDPVLSKGVKGVGLRWSKINFKKAVTQKIREYDQKLKALINFNVSEAFEKGVQAKVLTKIKKLLPTHHDARNAQDVEPSFNKRSHDNQDSPNNREGENKKKRRKDVGEPSRSSRRNKSPMIHAQVDTPAIQPLDQEDEYVQNHPNLEWFRKKSGTEEKYTTSITKHYAARYYKQGIEDMISGRWSKETHLYIFEALNGIHHWKDSRIDFFKAEMSIRTEGSVYSDLRIKSVVHVVVKNKLGYGFLSSIVVRRSDDKENEFSYADLPRLSLNDVEDMYLLQVQDKLHHLLLESVKDFNNALLLFIRRVVIQNRVDDIQLGVESYQKTLNLTKPMMFFEGIDKKIPSTMTAMHKGIVYLNQHNIKSLMKLSEVKKFCDGTLEKIRENLVDMVKRNKLGTANK
ncbi:hypothetical protein Tco_0657558 [Tanacetum coccineum]